MGLESIIEESKGERLPDDVTIGQLRQEFTDEAVRRGVEYMRSLVEADKNFRESADPDRMREGYEDAYDVETSGGDVEDGVNKWASSMEESGLGIDEE